MNLRVTGVGFSVHYPEGWMAHTTFREDLSVSGGHLSGGRTEVFLHKAEDKASPELWARLSELALKASGLPMKEPNPRPEKLYAITIDLSDGRNLRFETALEAGYQDRTLQALADLLHANERVYSNQQGKGWKLVPEAAVAWDEAVDGLCLGLFPAGSVAGLKREECEQWSCKVHERQSMQLRETCDFCGAKNPFGTNHCETCMAKYRLCRYCQASRPAGLPFTEGQPICLEVHFRNTGGKDLQLDDSWLWWRVAVIFAPKAGGAPRRACWDVSKKRTPEPIAIPRGGQRLAALVLDQNWSFVQDGKTIEESVPPLKQLPPGKYTVTASYEHPADHPMREDCPYWHGKVVTAPVEVEIKPKGGAAATPAAPAAAQPKISEARAREIAIDELAANYPHTKWRLDRLELVDGRVWQGRAQDAEPKPAMNSAEIEVDAGTGQVMAVRFIPGR